MQGNVAEEMAAMLDTRAVEALLPHRSPMRLVDSVMDVCIAHPSRIVATKYVGYREVWTRGHYPNRAIFPGVFVLEGLAQAGLLLFQLSGRRLRRREIPVLASANGKFLRPIFPGQTIIYKIELDKRIELGAIFHGTASVDERIVAKGDFVFGVKKWLDVVAK